MKSGWVYLVFGPIFGVLGSLLWVMIESGLSEALRDPAEGIVLALVFGFFVSWPSLFVDASLVRFLPIVLRAPLTAASGAAIALCCLAIAEGHVPPLKNFMLIAIVAACSMGACSLLANDFSKS